MVGKSSLEILEKFLPIHFVQLIIEQSDIYVLQRGVTLSISVEEIKTLLALYTDYKGCP